MAALLSAVGSAASTIGSSGLGSVIGNAMGGSGSIGNILGSLVGNSIQGDVNKDTGGLFGQPSGVSDILGLSGDQSGKAASQQQAQAPQTLSSNNVNQYSAPTYAQQFGTGGSSNFGSILTKLLGQ